MWTTDESCEEAIQGAWCPSNLTDGIENLRHNLQGEWVDNPTDLHYLIHEHFKEIYSSSESRDFTSVLDVITPVMNETMSLHLESPVLQSEIEKAVKNMGANKAPVFNEGVMPSSLNMTLVVLLPKIPAPENCMVIANEAFHYIRTKKKGEQRHIALKLDHNKAFDHVEWDFLMATCQKLGFGETWCKLVMACVASYEMEFMINGESIGLIKPSRVIRQGDSMSPIP
ncbi:hypothetical protein CTI12_AA092190 [Artemisia annua]|uniref:Reverse transcriptase domain-containing protein n=1 Tax=Artemisia annua TaxID=35608 RepID=A0A2U1Q014_ARTAN|nr:hypothetical protein CTI12_AA092190 [Artemisia annua]